MCVYSSPIGQGSATQMWWVRVWMKDEFADIFDTGSFLTPPQSGIKPVQYGLYGLIGKRAFDLVFASLALTLLSPLIAILWIFIRLDKGEGFFGHARVGRYGKIFTCWKLRTMHPNAELMLEDLLLQDQNAAQEWNTQQKLTDDPRVTRLGKLLRKTRLDELPQFWNVLIGDMSVVGPRPVTQEEIARYGAAANTILHLRPGITGLWQVSGQNEESYAERVALDSVYVDRMTFGLDLLVILRTMLTVFRMNGH